MSEAYYFDEGVLTLTESGDTTEFNPVGLQDLTITPAFEHEELFTAD